MDLYAHLKVQTIRKEMESGYSCAADWGRDLPPVCTQVDDFGQWTLEHCCSGQAHVCTKCPAATKGCATAGDPDPEVVSETNS